MIFVSIYYHYSHLENLFSWEIIVTVGNAPISSSSFENPLPCFLKYITFKTLCPVVPV